MLNFYRFMTGISGPAFLTLLDKRARMGKEIPERLNERQGKPSQPRPQGPLVWIHAASVGEAQSMLILIDELLRLDSALQILVTTGTATSAAMMTSKLPERCFHQFYPLDHPEWVDGFLNHWNPDMVFWMESEIWPNMLSGIKARNIPAALVNARLSRKSFLRWRLIKPAIKKILGSFTLILCQTQRDAEYFADLGATHTKVTDNLKFSAKPLPAVDADLKKLGAATSARPTWVYASSHAGEEDLACRVHEILKATLPDILTIIVPRHPDRRADIKAVCDGHKLNTALRGPTKTPPQSDTDIYIADTMGELGLFYRLAPVCCVGRSFSDDGGGGHNPIEAAQLNCVALHGPHVQYQQDIYNEMNAAGAAFQMKDEAQLIDTLRLVLTDENVLRERQKTALAFAHSKEEVIKRVMSAILPLLEQAGISRSQNRVVRL